VKYLPKSFKLQDRERSVEQMEAEELEDFIRLAHESRAATTSRVLFRQKNIEFALGSIVYMSE
jgi:hypothetical protein